jgi:hypothetical protein
MQERRPIRLETLDARVLAAAALRSPLRAAVEAMCIDEAGVYYQGRMSDAMPCVSKVPSDLARSHRPSVNHCSL